MEKKAVRSAYQERYAMQFDYVGYHEHLLEYLFLRPEIEDK